jgi:hypothetical protein
MGMIIGLLGLAILILSIVFSGGSDGMNDGHGNM